MQMTHHEKFEFNEVNGSVYTKRFCCLCIAQKVPQPLLHAEPRKRNHSKLSVDFCIMYTLPTCIQVRNKLKQQPQNV